MTEASELCDRVLMMDAGRVLADGSVPDLIARYAPGQHLEQVFMRLSGESFEEREAEADAREVSE